MPNNLRRHPGEVLGHMSVQEGASLVKQLPRGGDFHGHVGQFE